jgi:hypothetical protein
MTREQAKIEIKKHPEIIKFCIDNFWNFDCPRECPYYQKCKSLDYEINGYKATMYPRAFRALVNLTR